MTRGLGNERKWKANGKLDWIVRSSDNRSFKLCVWHYLPLFYHLLLCTNSLHLTGKFWKYLRKLWRCLLGNREMELKVYFLLRLGTSECLNGSVSAPFWPRKVGILKKKNTSAKKDIFQDSAFVSDVHLCSVHLVTRLGPVWHTFTTSCFCFVKGNTFPKNFFSQQVYVPLLSCNWMQVWYGQNVYSRRLLGKGIRFVWNKVSFWVCMSSESIEDVLLNSIMALIEKLFKSPSDSWISTQHHAEY